ncbi:MAG: rhomboid family intramembrane serine protease [Elusimicrobiales bacterium]
MGEAPKKISADMLAGDPFHPSQVDFERGMSVAPFFAIALIAANSLAFAWELSVGALKSREAVIAAGAVYGDKVFAGESWRLGTGMFLHAGLGHLIGNCVVLYILGMVSQRAWGAGYALAIYFASGLSSSLLSAAMQPRPSVGASGAIFGLLGAVVVFFYRYSGSFRARDRRIGAGLLGWGIFQLSLGFLSPIVDNWGHMGGLAAGAVLALVLPSAICEKEPEGASVH